MMELLCLTLKKNYDILGFEPSLNVAKIARKKD